MAGRGKRGNRVYCCVVCLIPSWPSRGRAGLIPCLLCNFQPNSTTCLGARGGPASPPPCRSTNTYGSLALRTGAGAGPPTRVMLAQGQGAPRRKRHTGMQHTWLRRSVGVYDRAVTRSRVAMAAAKSVSTEQQNLHDSLPRHPPLAISQPYPEFRDRDELGW